MTDPTPWSASSFRFEIVDGEWCSGRYLEIVPGNDPRVEGDASRLYRLAGPLMALLVHRSVQRDLRTLKRLLENGAEPPISPG